MSLRIEDRKKRDEIKRALEREKVEARKRAEEHKKVISKGLQALDQLKAAKSLKDFASIVRFKPSSISFILYKAAPDHKYSSFPIAKKSGGTRRINAPYPPLRELQSRLAALLSEIYPAIDGVSASGRRLPKKLKPLSHGFRKGRSTLTNAEIHVRQRSVFNVDLEDFFPSFNFGRVRGFFSKNSNFQLHPDVATIIAQIACHDNELPQGAPSSPIITNLITHSLDLSLARLAGRHGCNYSRYADDITFSTKAKDFPMQVARQIGQEWVAGEDLCRAIEKSGFRVNEKKTRMSGHKSRQTVTGLTVNRHVNIRQSYYRSARAMAHSLFLKGTYTLPSGGSYPKDRPKLHRNRFANWIGSRSAFLSKPLSSFLGALWRIFGRFSKVTHAGKSEDFLIDEIKSLDKLHGIISHIYHVKKSVGNGVPAGKGISKLYRDFLLYQRFYAPVRPLIVCEGKTDIIYLKSAIRSLYASYPNLVRVDPDGRKVLLIDFLNPESQVATVLGLPGGEAHIRTFVDFYKRDIRGFRANRNSVPVMFIVDNDSGGKNVYNLVNKDFGKSIDLLSGAGVTALTDNLYLLSTDPVGPTGESYAEMFFDLVDLAKNLHGGRVFKFVGDVNRASECGKVEFANEIVLAGRAVIDFTGFVPLLDRISSVVSMHSSASASASASASTSTPTLTPTRSVGAPAPAVSAAP